MDDVAYYDSQLQYQKRVGEIEKEHLQLEREMFAMMRSDKKLQNMRAAKLRTYWQQVCEREKKARERNEELLSDFEQLEIKLVSMEARTNKLRKMKMEYDEKVKRMYPKWREEVELARAKRQLQERGISFTHAHEAAAANTSKASSRSAIQLPSPGLEVSREKSKSDTMMLSMRSPAKTPITSTPKSVPDASEQVSVQPPPASFADTVAGETSHVTTTSPVRSLQKIKNVVHTIPTAFSTDGGNSDFSDTSMISNSPAVTGKSPKAQASFQPSSQSDLLPPPQKSPKKDSSQIVSRPDLFIATSSNAHHAYEEQPFEEYPQRHKSPVHAASAATTPSKVSPVRISQLSSPVTAVSKESDAARPPEPRPASKLSISSFGSDDMSPRSNAIARSNIPQRSNQPLTASAAYQALLKQHSGANEKSLEVPVMGEGSEEDDLENILSPLASGKFELPGSESESVHNENGNAPMYIPTAMSAGPSTQPQQQSKSRSVPKAPWDTDSEDEIGNGTNLSNTGGSSMWDQKLKKYDAEDDFDFYD